MYLGYMHLHDEDFENGSKRCRLFTKAAPLLRNGSKSCRVTLYENGPLVEKRQCLFAEVEVTCDAVQLYLVEENPLENFKDNQDD